MIILALSLFTRFAFFGYPAETVFDEVHFGKFVSGYFTGEYFFDIHPPLGKLLIADMAKISGFEPGFSFETIGQKFTNDSYKWLRFLPKLTGALLPIVIFLTALKLGISQKFAFLSSLLLIFENSLVVQSRFILLDSFLLLFGFLAIFFCIRHMRHGMRTADLFFTGLFAILAASIKWTGFTFLGLTFIFYLIEWLKSPQKIKLTLNGLIFLAVIPFLIYFSIFAVHFSLLDKPGPGLAFHSSDFQQKNIFLKFVELNIELYESNARLTTAHPYSSKWYEWPFMTRPIFYWDGPSSPEASEGTVARIYLLGNPLIWWLSTITVIYFLINIFKKLKSVSSSHSLLAFGYLLNLLPFIFIGRVMFLYHYFVSLIFAVLILTHLLDKTDFKHKKIAFNTILISSIILFIFFSPLTYGLTIPDWYYKLTVWLPGWR